MDSFEPQSTTILICGSNESIWSASFYQMTNIFPIQKNAGNSVIHSLKWERKFHYSTSKEATILIFSKVHWLMSVWPVTMLNNLFSKYKLTLFWSAY